MVARFPLEAGVRWPKSFASVQLLGRSGSISLSCSRKWST